jgi:hypothetical protein
VELTSAVLVRALGLCCGEEPDGPGEAVALARMRQPSFASLLCSAWQAEGRELSPTLLHELDAQHRRIGRFRDTAAVLAGAMPRAVPLKGLEVADLYPFGWARYMNDLDYAVPDETELWRGVAALTGDGWEIHSGTFVVAGGRLHVLVSLRRPDEDPDALPRGVEIATFTAIGDLGGVPMLVELPEPWRAPAVKNLLMLLHERFEQPYRARDLVDAALLLDAVGTQDRATLWAAVDQLGLWPEYAELAGLLDEAGLGPVPAPPRPLPAAVAAARRRRTARQLAGAGRPAGGALRYLQRRMVRGELRAPERWVWGAAQGRVRAGWALRAGLVTFGLPVDGGPPGLAGAVVRERRGVTWVDTPAGRFVLAVGDELPESAFDVLAAEGSPPAADAEPSTLEERATAAAGPDR